VDAIFIPELDNKSNPLKSKGVGELGICGAGASLANAIYNACGARVRDYPITLDSCSRYCRRKHDKFSAFDRALQELSPVPGVAPARVGGHREAENAPRGWLAVTQQAAAVRFDDRSADRQPMPQTVGFRL